MPTTTFSIMTTCKPCGASGFGDVRATTEEHPVENFPAERGLGPWRDTSQAKIPMCDECALMSSGYPEAHRSRA